MKVKHSKDKKRESEHGERKRERGERDETGEECRGRKCGGGERKQFDSCVGVKV